MTSALRPPGNPSSLAFPGEFSRIPPDLLFLLGPHGLLSLRTSCFSGSTVPTQESYFCDYELFRVNYHVFPELYSYSLVREKNYSFVTHSQDEKNIKACGLFLPPDLVSPIWLFGSPSGEIPVGIFATPGFAFLPVISSDFIT